jgi:hypothetical protein
LLRPRQPFHPLWLALILTRNLDGRKIRAWPISRRQIAAELGISPATGTQRS